MQFNIKTRLNAGFTTAILLVLLVGVISFFTFKRQYEEAASLKHSYQVINELEQIQKVLIEMETGRRGFRSTNEKRFLQPYYLGLQQIEPSLNNLRQLLKNDTDQQEKAEVIENEITSLLSFWRNLGEDASKYTRERIITIMTDEIVKMDLVRSGIAEMLQIENRALNKNQIENNRSINWAAWALFISILLILCIVILLIIQILKEFKNRRKAEAGLKKNYKELAVVNQENAERNWLLTGINKVNAILQGHLDAKALSQVVLDTVIKYLKMKAGAFYVYNEDTKKLLLTSSYALPNTAKSEYALHEGLVGQAAAEKEPVIITNIPSKYTTVDGGTVQIEPVQAIYASLFHQGELTGIIEILSFEPIGKQSIKFLQVVGNNIAAALHTVMAREKVLQLLNQVRQQKDRLEKQQEELTQTNEELTVQAEVLQTSEEELKVQEEELRQINAELKKKNEAIEMARHDLSVKAKELEASGKYKSEFLANMSHELRTPLNSVLILAKLLVDDKEHNLTEKQVAHARIIHKSGSDLLELINDILDLSKIEAGKVDLYLDEVAIKNIANDIEQLFGVVAEEKEIDFKIIVEKGVPEKIKTDKQKVEQVLKNLLSNAFKFTSKKGNVHLRFRPVTDKGISYIAISVKDSGIGIAPDKQHVIFEAFQQADGSTNRRFGGTGLGLSITKELMRILKGKVYVESEENKGSTFTILVPAAGDSVGVKDIAETESPEITFPVSVNEQTKIKDDRKSLTKDNKVMLIIEDDEMFAFVIKNFAVSHGYKTVVALSGDEGLYCARKYSPSAIILDMQLPVINGDTLLSIFKEDPDLKHIPVHIISGDDNSAETLGALAFLKKPVDKKDLEKAFLLIGEYLQSAVKRVMILSKDNLKDDILKKLISEKNYDIVCDTAKSVNDVLSKVQELKYDCIIADIGSNVKDGIAQLNFLHSRLLPQQIPTIIYLDQDITPADELELKRIADVVVRESSLSNHRLMDELELFLYRVQQNTARYPGKYTPSDNGDGTLRNKKVLLVDDDMRNIFALSAALEQEQMDITTASDGREALHMLQKNKNTDIVLMDVMMPEMDGYDTIRHIRNDMKMTRLPVIALTAKAMAGDREKCIEAGASDYIPKPVDIQKLVALMRVWLS